MTGKYYEYNINRTALIKESLILINLYTSHKSWKKVAFDVYEENVLAKTSKASMDKIYTIIRKRYLPEKVDFLLTPFVKIITSSLPDSVKVQCMYYEFVKKDKLIFDLITEVLYKLYVKGYNTVSKEQIDEFLKNQEVSHPEIKQWSITTRARMIRHFLSTMKEFGILEGHTVKEFSRLYMPIETFVYILYSESLSNFTTKELLNSNIWKIFLFDLDDVRVLLSESAKKGFITLEEKGDIINIIYKYKNLEEVVNGITSE